jgi:hypothetical protein
MQQFYNTFIVVYYSEKNTLSNTFYLYEDKVINNILGADIKRLGLGRNLGLD